MLCLLAIVNQIHGFNETTSNQKRWTYTDDSTSDFYDDDDDYGQASNYISMKVKPNLAPTSYQHPILVVPDQQPIQNVIVTKVTAPVKPQYNGYSSMKAAVKNPYDTPPGSFTPQSYGGPSNYGNLNFFCCALILNNFRCNTKKKRFFILKKTTKKHLSYNQMMRVNLKEIKKNICLDQ